MATEATIRPLLTRQALLAQRRELLDALRDVVAASDADDLDAHITAVENARKVVARAEGRSA